MDFAQVTDAIRSSALSQHADLLIQHLKLSARIVVEDGSGAGHSCITRSHFGGLPSLSKNSKWPYWDKTAYLQAQIAHNEESFKNNPRATGFRDDASRLRDELKRAIVPLDFLGQLDLSELCSAAPLPGWPSEGTLLFFYASTEQPWGYDPSMQGHCRVIYYPVTEETKVMQAPEDLPDETRFPERAMCFLPELTLPTLIDAEDANLIFWGNEDYEDLCDSIMSLQDDDGPIHRCGGEPQEIQGDMQRECQLVTNGIFCGDLSSDRDPRVPILEQNAADWQLLLQIDSDEDRLGWMWGDCGRLYFWARQQDIAQANFDRSWAVLQCY